MLYRIIAVDPASTPGHPFRVTSNMTDTDLNAPHHIADRVWTGWTLFTCRDAGMTTADPNPTYPSMAPQPWQTHAVYIYALGDIMYMYVCVHVPQSMDRSNTLTNKLNT